MKKIYEWEVTLSTTDRVYLTEKQYEFYKENWKQGQLFFKFFAINSSFVVLVKKQHPDHLKEMYPCSVCGRNGFIISKKDPETGKFPECTHCEGTGIEPDPAKISI